MTNQTEQLAAVREADEQSRWYVDMNDFYADAVASPFHVMFWYITNELGDVPEAGRDFITELVHEIERLQGEKLADKLNKMRKEKEALVESLDSCLSLLGAYAGVIQEAQWEQIDREEIRSEPSLASTIKNGQSALDAAKGEE